MTERVIVILTAVLKTVSTTVSTKTFKHLCCCKPCDFKFYAKCHIGCSKIYSWGCGILTECVPQDAINQVWKEDGQAFHEMEHCSPCGSKKILFSLLMGKQQVECLGDDIAGKFEL